MNKKHSREKQAEVLRRTQEQRKQQKREQVFRAVEELLVKKQPLTFSNIAQVAGCSVSYLYKWTEITAYIHDLQKQETEQLNPLEEKEHGPHSLKTLHEVSKQRIRKLEGENTELKRQNELLRGHVAEIFELQDENERLRTQLLRLTQPLDSAKVIPLHSPNKSPEKIKKEETANVTIAMELEQLGITLNTTLKKTISGATEETVKMAIEALKEQLNKQKIPNPGGWLNKAVKEGWTKPEPISKPPQTLSLTSNEVNISPDKKLISAEKLKSLNQSLSNLFKDRNDE